MNTRKCTDNCKGKGKVHRKTGHEYSSTLSLTSAKDGVGGQRHAPAALPREMPGTHCIGGWVGPRTGLDGAESPTKTSPCNNGLIMCRNVRM